jgi:hypothetical protein
MLTVDDRYQPQPHCMVQVEPFGVPLHVRLEPHLSSTGWHMLSNPLLSTVVVQLDFPAQH